MNGTYDIAMPTVENNMLVFRSSEHYNAYVAYLDSITTQLTDAQEDMYANDERDPQEIILDELEEGLGFLSLRKVLSNRFDAENAIGWDSERDFPISQAMVLKIVHLMLKRK
jgi:hypothetical protein